MLKSLKCWALRFFSVYENHFLTIKRKVKQRSKKLVSFLKNKCRNISSWGEKGYVEGVIQTNSNSITREHITILYTFIFRLSKNFIFIASEIGINYLTNTRGKLGNFKENYVQNDLASNLWPLKKLGLQPLPLSLTLKCIHLKNWVWFYSTAI